MRWARAQRPVKMEVLKELLGDYPNKADGSYLWEWFTVGFQIPFMGTRTNVMSKKFEVSGRDKPYCTEKDYTGIK